MLVPSGTWHLARTLLAPQQDQRTSPHPPTPPLPTMEKELNSLLLEAVSFPADDVPSPLSAQYRRSRRSLLFEGPREGGPH